ncbi:unnamed protein product [Brassica oleracea var. botrytis]
MVPLVPLHPFTSNYPQPVLNGSNCSLAVSPSKTNSLSPCPCPGLALISHGPIAPHKPPARPSNRSDPTILVRTGTLHQAELS